MQPVTTSLEPVPVKILKLILRTCKRNWSTQQCNCVKGCVRYSTPWNTSEGCTSNNIEIDDLNLPASDEIINILPFEYLEVAEEKSDSTSVNKDDGLGNDDVWKLMICNINLIFEHKQDFWDFQNKIYHISLRNISNDLNDI